MYTFPKGVYLDTGYTVVVSDPELLSVVCGSNDDNLRVMEEYLGVPVLSRGNELTVASSNADTCRKFQLLIDKLVSLESASGNSGEFISSLIVGMDNDAIGNSVTDGIRIPHGIKRVYPKTEKQALFMSALKEKSVVFGIGPAGTGKTFIAVAHALALVLSRTVRKMVLTRPVVEAGESLGFLPGDLEQKISPYLRPLYDAIEMLVPPDVIKRMEDSRMIEIAPLAYMRGRSLNDSVILLDEAQNTTIGQMKMFLTRMGGNSRIIVTGDPSQIDLPPKTDSGLLHSSRVLADIDEIALINLDSKDIVRNPLVKKIIQAYEQKKD